MFWSKIWFFVVALAATVALTIALVLPRPAQRSHVAEEQQRLAVACSVVGILLADDARNRVDLAGAFARSPELVAALEAASAADKLDETRMKSVRDLGESVMKTIQGRKPDFAMLIDRRGRVVARVRLDENYFRDVAAGRPLVDDALAGYLRDDLWIQNNTVYLVSGAPVIKRDPPTAYVGAVVLGHAITNDLAGKLVGSLHVDLGFHVGADDIAGSKAIALDHEALRAAAEHLKGGDPTRDCQANPPLNLRAGDAEYTAVVARLPGEASPRQAYYSVFIERPRDLGFAGTFGGVRQADLSFSNFPWLVVGGAFLVTLVLGIGLMLLEADRPLRRLTSDAVGLAKGDRERLGEDGHPGKFGSIARSVNIAIDKLGRDAKTAKQDLDQLLGPAPEGSLGTIDLLASALPAVRPGGAAPAATPPPSEFRFSDPGPAAPPPREPVLRSTPSTPSTPAIAAAPPAPAAPPPRRAASAPATPGMPPPRAATAPVMPPPPAAERLDDDILGGAELLPEPAAASAEDYFQGVFDQFVELKKSCGETIVGLTFTKFADKLRKNRDELMTKTQCKDVRFTVYVKDGKAALKATPVKDE